MWSVFTHIITAVYHIRPRQIFHTSSVESRTHGMTDNNLA